MGFFEIFMIGVGLSMDAFAASVCKGLSMRKAEVEHTDNSFVFWRISGADASHRLCSRKSV